jgi:hypothetical protein
MPGQVLGGPAALALRWGFVVLEYIGIKRSGPLLIAVCLAAVSLCKPAV